LREDNADEYELPLYDDSYLGSFFWGNQDELYIRTYIIIEYFLIHGIKDQIKNNNQQAQSSSFFFPYPYAYL
jgi:hypothetical protein